MTQDRSKRDVGVLAACLAMNQTALSLMMTIAALSGQMLAGANPTLATLPLAFLFISIMVCTIPASLLMGRIGRRGGFAVGALIGVAGGLVCALAIRQGDLWLLAAGMALFGCATAHANYYRFAAAEVASRAFRSRAISLVLAGGVVAAIAGPFLGARTADLFAPFTFAGGFTAMAVLSAVILPLLLFVRFPTAVPVDGTKVASEPARPLGEIMRQPTFLVAAFAAMVGYGSMNLLMVSTPLAMQFCGFALGDSASVIQWYVLGMYVPSFFTGQLIRRFGVLRVISAGALLILAAAGVNLSGIEYLNFWSGLILLGVGWNFLFVGGTTLLTETYRPSERTKTQAANDFLVFGTTALTALSSGAVFHSSGWSMLNLGVIPALILVIGAVAWLGLRRRRTIATA